MSEIESVLFNTRYWDKYAAIQWLDDHGLLPIKPLHITKRFIHARIQNPSQFERLRVKHTKKHLEFILGF